MDDADATADPNAASPDGGTAAAVPDEPDQPLLDHLAAEAAVVAGVLESSLDRAIPIDESRVEWGHPLVPERPQLADALAIRFQQDERSCACLLPAWMLPDADTATTVPDDLPSRLIAALLPASLSFHQPRRAETAELIAPELWKRASRPQALRVPFDGREDPLWVLLGVDDERQRIGQQRLSSVPVRVVVTLAEKRIEVGQLTSISPGTLIAFSKPCEDLLDLYVNNRRFCRGEAVKIGEKFGLKVTEVGRERPRESPVLQPLGAPAQ